MGDFRKKIKSLIHRYYSWLTLISKENKNGYESEYAEYEVNPDQVSYSDRKCKIPKMTVHFKITMTERAAYEDLLVYWEYGDCYYQIEELERYAVMPTPEDISDIPDIKS